MSKKLLQAILCAFITIAAISAAVNIRPQAENIPAPLTEASASEAEAAPEPELSGYKVILEDGAVCLYTLDQSGAELDRKIIDYIDIYSLYSSQLDALREGVLFDSREAAAEFIQDLGS